MSQVPRFLNYDTVSEMQRRGIFFPGNFNLISPTLSINEQRMIMERVPVNLQQSTLDMHNYIEEMKKQHLFIPSGILQQAAGFGAFVQMHQRLRIQRELPVVSNVKVRSSIAFAQAAMREPSPPQIDGRLTAAFIDGLSISSAAAQAQVDFLAKKHTAPSKKGGAKQSKSTKSKDCAEKNDVCPENRKKKLQVKEMDDCELHGSVEAIVEPPRTILLPKSARVKIDFQKLGGGAVSMCGSVLCPHHFKDWTDQNGNSHFVHMLSCIWHCGTWIWRIGFSNGTYARFHDINRVLDNALISPAKAIPSLHQYAKEIYAVAWLARPDVTPPPPTVLPNLVRLLLSPNPRGLTSLGTSCVFSRRAAIPCTGFSAPTILYTPTRRLDCASFISWLSLPSPR
jgi:invasion protein IalB